jgi:hypothetical protein
MPYPPLALCGTGSSPDTSRVEVGKRTNVNYNGWYASKSEAAEDAEYMKRDYPDYFTIEIVQLRGDRRGVGTGNERVSVMVPSERDAQDVPHLIVNSLRRTKGVLAALIIAIVVGVIIALVVI